METSAEIVKTDILTPDDIRRLIDEFYAEVRRDDLLGPVFAARIPAGHWPEHLDTMTRFWTAALLGQAAGYRGNPGAKHLYLPIEKAHFTRWLALFGQTVDALFAGENVAEMKVRTLRMGEMFQAKIASARANGGLSVL
ncbi:group III truncated hemoglobin [Hymenobacter artigasi]|uniref:Hemoglobin n=1 Tax=Hymenobacter artigasi TaxID=2719616 RepID=A0ABX1HKY8_9BACT|nr:group III truncated hemoglobin [Hymenobacter artigasi]NKI90924.1 hemoglobin [Hymenobacter artigasi]